MEKIKEVIKRRRMQNIRGNTRKYAGVILYSCIFVFLFLFFSVSVAQAANLYLSPSSDSYIVGDTFSVGVFISSDEQVMNAASGAISFSQDKLEVLSLAKSSSIISLWVQEPTFSNSAGTISFEGIVLNPGFTGSAGKVIVINFKAKTAGDASLIFSSGSILANDGKGTNILASLGSALFTIEAEAPAVPEAPAPEEPEATILSPPVAGKIPAAPKVSSPTHPDPEKWYAHNNPEFEMSLPKGITGVNVLADREPDTNPGTRSDGLFSSYTYEDVDDGVWYFHVRLRNAYGWGDISHFPFQIDTEPPEPITIKFVEGKEIIQPRMKVIFNTADSLSGIDYYQIKIHDSEPIALSSKEILPHNPYTLSPQKPGKHTIEVIAFDKAENSATAKDEFIIKPEIAPRIIDYPQELSRDEVLTVKGETIYPNAQIVLWLQKDEDEPQSYVRESDQEGIFTFEGKEKLKDGIYKFWAVVIDDQGNQSKLSERVTITIRQSLFSSAKSWIMKIGRWSIELLAVAIPLIALVAFFAFLLWYSWHKFSKWRMKAKKEIRKAEKTLRKALDKSRRDIQEQIKVLEKIRDRRKSIEEKERKIIEQLKKDLKYAEGFTKKEIKDIEEELK